jgi:hypothetical protein
VWLRRDVSVGGGRRVTAPEIAERLVASDKPITPERVRKLTKLCERSAVPVSDVLALLNEEQATAVDPGYVAPVRERVSLG